MSLARVAAASAADACPRTPRSCYCCAACGPLRAYIVLFLQRAPSRPVSVIDPPAFRRCSSFVRGRVAAAAVSFAPLTFIVVLRS